MSTFGIKISHAMTCTTWQDSIDWTRRGSNKGQNYIGLFARLKFVLNGDEYYPIKLVPFTFYYQQKICTLNYCKQIKKFLWK